MKKKVISAKENTLKQIGVEDENISLEIPKIRENGDYSSNVAIKNAIHLRTLVKFAKYLFM